MSTIEHVEGLRDCLIELVEQADTIEKIADIIFSAYKENKQIFVMGNGGSALTASHCALGFEKQSAVESKKRIKAISLTDNVGLITAWANDENYVSIFKEQLVNKLCKGDVVICISVSGSSPNIIEAAIYSQEQGAIVIGFVGFGGGKLWKLADECVALSSKNYGQVEDIHLALTHILSDILRGKIANN